ncbi:MAG: (2Fe-2S)-binding protein [bacterium]|nr:(2Fe-2S)-binding protein [bacterium]
MIDLQFELNGRGVTARVQTNARLLDMLRDVLGETGTKEGCGEGECGACTVLVDGLAINACLFPAAEAEGTKITTIEGLTQGGAPLSPVQDAYLQNGGAQCGFCSPGMVMATVALLGETPDPSDTEIQEALRGNLCRCTGYVQIVQSVRAAAETINKGGINA